MSETYRCMCLLIWDWTKSIMNDFVTLVRVVVPNFAERVVLSMGALIGGWLSYSIGGFDEGVNWLFAFCLIDYLTGNWAALKTGKWESKKAFQGIFKKFFIFIMVAICNGVDISLHVDFVRDACIFAYIVNEVGSLIENIARAGYADVIPTPLRNALKLLKEREENKVSKNEGSN